MNYNKRLISEKGGVISMWNLDSNQSFEQFIPVQVPRRRVFEHFAEVEGKKLIFISAPGGSGKTTTTRLWVEKTGKKEIWLDLDDLDNSLSTFYRTLCTNIVYAQPENTKMMETFQKADFIASPTDYAVQLLTEFAVDAIQYILVVDNFQLINDPNITKSFSQIIKRLPISFTTVVISRKDPDNNFIPYFQNGQAAMLNGGVLFFDKKEIRNYFALQKKDIDPEDAEMIYSLTDGWPIAVAKMAQDSAFDINESTLPKSIKMHRLYSYVFEYFWDEWSEQEREFMVKISLLPFISPEIISRITDDKEKKDLLDSLCKTSTLVSKVEDNSYRFNPLFLDFLANQKEYIRDEGQEFNLEIARLYQQSGKSGWALSYAYKSEDIALIVDILEGYSFRDIFVINSESELLKDIALSQLAKKLSKEHPVLHIFSALVSFREGDSISFEYHADNLMKNRAKLLGDYPQFTMDIFSIVAFDYRMTTAKFKEQWIKTDMLEFISNPDESRSNFLSLGFPLLQHSFKDFIHIYDEKNYAMNKIIIDKLFTRNADAFMSNIESGLSLEQNNFSEALKKILSTLSLLDYDAPTELHFSAQMQLAMTYFASGKKEYQDTMTALHEYTHKNTPDLLPNFMAIDTRMKLWEGDKAAATNWLNQHFVSENSIFMQIPLIEQYYTTGISYLVTGEYEKARQLFFKLRHLAEKFRRPHDAIECEIYLSLSCHVLNEKDEAQYRLETALVAMQKYDLIRVAAKEGHAILPILKIVLGRVTHQTYDGPLDPTFVNRVYLAAVDVSNRHRGILANQIDKKIKLSKKQQEILELFADGYNREDVVDEMGISLNTVKTHINNLYTKLDVQNKLEAITKAKEFGLID